MSSNTINNSMSLGLYISVPFCRTKCTYCNFASDVFSKSAYENYVVRLLEDIANSRQLASELGCTFRGALGFTHDDTTDSIYLGASNLRLRPMPRSRSSALRARLRPLSSKPSCNAE
jgi:hypothetical protein